MSVSLQPYLPNLHSACAALYCHLCPVCYIFPHFLKTGTILEKSYLKKRLYVSQTQPFYYPVIFTWAICYDSFLSHLQVLFLRYKSLLPTLKTHYEIPNTYNFFIVTLCRCMFHQFYYMDRVHSLYIFKIINNGRYFNLCF